MCFLPADFFFLGLWGNGIGDSGAIAIGKSLETNNSLTKLKLNWNLIGSEGGIAIGDALQHNFTLTSLNLWDNKIGASGAERLADALIVNTSLQELNLSYNKIGAEGANRIANALKINKSLQNLNLGGNSIGPEGASNIADALKINNSLQKLYLGSIANEVEMAVVPSALQDDIANRSPGTSGAEVGQVTYPFGPPFNDGEGVLYELNSFNPISSGFVKVSNSYRQVHSLYGNTAVLNPFRKS